LSLPFSQNLDVALNEWRVIIIEPALFYFLFRFQRLEDREIQIIVDAFLMGGLVVALIGLWQYATGQNLITSEGGLMRLRSIYGSPNNVALLLGRCIPILAATILVGRGRRRIAYAAILVPVAVAMFLTFSKGALFLGLPAALLALLILWRRQSGGQMWPWLAASVALGLFTLLIITQVPELASRLDLRGETGFFRINLWRASVNIFKDHPIVGVGLDNFLYAYRGGYIFDTAWQEPNLSHPHNIVLDFATRLGVIGLVAGTFFYGAFVHIAWKIQDHVTERWRALAIGLFGSLVYTFAHGLVDHSFFLVDLAYVTYLLLAIAIFLASQVRDRSLSATSSALRG
jgi:O-antigen ligase